MDPILLDVKSGTLIRVGDDNRVDANSKSKYLRKILATAVEWNHKWCYILTDSPTRYWKFDAPFEKVIVICSMWDVDSILDGLIMREKSVLIVDLGPTFTSIVFDEIRCATNKRKLRTFVLSGQLVGSDSFDSTIEYNGSKSFERFLECAC